MAQVPKATAVAPQATASTARVGPGSRVASFGANPVEELNSGVNISFDAAASGSRGQDERSRPNLGNGSRDPHAERAISRLFRTESQAFASIFQGDDKEITEASRATGFGKPVSSAINTYETNAQVISGSQPIRGTSLSLTL